MVNISNAAEPTHRFISPASENIVYFAVGQDGLVLYDAEAPNRDIQRAILPNGELVAPPSWLFYYWTGVTGLFANNNQDDVFSLQSDGTGDITSKTYIPNLPIATGNLSTQLTFPERFLLVTDREIVEVENPKKQPREITTIFDQIFEVLATNEHYYLSGATGYSANILQIDPETNAQLPLLPENAFEVGPMSVAADGRIRFDALRLHDKTDVVGLIDSTGNIEYVTEILFDGELRSLIRL